ncbi:MAG: TRAP transporter large permease, partial [Eubacteriales bacterium]|nr:TRAP transporter large permease [Eubacteriales bacterium]
LVLVLLGVNVGLSMFISGFLGYAFLRGFDAAVSILGTYTVSTSMNYSMTVIPLFVLMGQFVYGSGISDDLFRSTRVWFGRRRGALAYAGVISCTMFGAICGSLAATTATMSRVAKPIMKEHGYKDEIIGGCLACSGTLGALIPPSTQFILYGVMAEVSIGKLFAAGVFPGIVSAICFCGVIFFWCRFDPALCPSSDTYNWKEKIKALSGVWRMLLLFTIVLGGMFSGVFSVTESAAVGVVIAFIIMVLRKKCTKENIKRCAFDTIATTGMVMLSIVGAGVFGCFITLTRLPSAIAEGIQELSVSPVLVVAMIIVIYSLLGCIMDTLALILLSIPIFMPLIETLGLDPVWFGVILIMIMNLGAVTPPIGLSCYVASGVTGIELNKVFKGALPFLAAFFIAFIIILLIPDISLFLPGLLYK